MKATQAEIIRFLVKMEGYIITAGRDAKVYSGDDTNTAAYVIPSAMFTAMIDEELVTLIKLPTGSRRYILTEKGLRLGTRRGLAPEGE